jgi:hypothetical protein
MPCLWLAVNTMGEMGLLRERLIRKACNNLISLFLHPRLLQRLKSQLLIIMCPLYSVATQEDDQTAMFSETSPYVTPELVCAWGLAGPYTVRRSAQGREQSLTSRCHSASSVTWQI